MGEKYNPVHSVSPAKPNIHEGHRWGNLKSEGERLAWLRDDLIGNGFTRAEAIQIIASKQIGERV